MRFRNGISLSQVTPTSAIEMDRPNIRSRDTSIQSAGDFAPMSPFPPEIGPTNDDDEAEVVQLTFGINPPIYSLAACNPISMIDSPLCLINEHEFSFMAFVTISDITPENSPMRWDDNDPEKVTSCTRKFGSHDDTIVIVGKDNSASEEEEEEEDDDDDDELSLASHPSCNGPGAISTPRWRDGTSLLLSASSPTPTYATTSPDPHNPPRSYFPEHFAYMPYRSNDTAGSDLVADDDDDDDDEDFIDDTRKLVHVMSFTDNVNNSAS
jgi:hypothetical protein